MNVKIDESNAGINILYLCRNDKLNALSKIFVEEILVALSRLEVEANKMRFHCLVVASAVPKAFCVGADLGERLKMDETEIVETLDLYARLMNALEQFPTPVITAIQGAAFGGGLEMALACDLRVASATATMGLSETRLGIIPGAGGTQRLMRLVGVGRARDLVFRGAKVTGEQAHQIGFVEHCADDALQRAVQVGQEISEGGPLGIRAAKKVFSRGPWGDDLGRGLEWERRCYEGVLKTEDRVEALKAFVEKRKPKFKGR